MLIRFVFDAVIEDASTGEAISLPAGTDCVALGNQTLDQYLGAELANQGVIGGELTVSHREGRAWLFLDYWCRGPADELVELLKEEALGQMSDGYGEGGIRCQLWGGDVLIHAEVDTLSVEVVEDGRALPPPPVIAIAAREGNVSALAAAMKEFPESIDRLHQGYSPLQLAILYGRLEAAKLLLAAGANPLVRDAMGQTSLMLCAVANRYRMEKAVNLRGGCWRGALIRKRGTNWDRRPRIWRSRGRSKPSRNFCEQAQRSGHRGVAQGTLSNDRHAVHS